MPLSFGNFDEMCRGAALIVCPVLDSDMGIQPVCYSRNVNLAGNIIFQPAVIFMHAVALFMVAIMVFHIRSKYTAVGRKEILMFFWLYALDQFLALFLDAGIIPSSHEIYPWFAAIYIGLITATYWSLMLNGFVGFQVVEDGTPLSLWIMRLTCLAFFLIGFFFSIGTFKDVAFSKENPIALWVIVYPFNLICVIVYVVSQLLLVWRTLDDRWPLGDIIFGVLAYTIGLVLLYGFGQILCDRMEHYLDATFFFELCTLLAVMMVYKYWDSITKEDLEFSVGSKMGSWDIKEPMMDYEEDNLNAHAPSNPGYGSYPPPPVKQNNYAY